MYYANFSNQIREDLPAGPTGPGGPGGPTRSYNKVTAPLSFFPGLC